MYMCIVICICIYRCRGRAQRNATEFYMGMCEEMQPRKRNRAIISPTMIHKQHATFGQTLEFQTSGKVFIFTQSIVFLKL